MAQYSITIEAESRDMALNKAANQLNVASDNIDLKSAGKNMFIASVVNMDALIKIALSEDKMEAFIVEAYLHKGNGIPLSPSLFQNALKTAGVTIAPIEGIYEELEQKLKTGTDLSNLTVATGVAPINGEDGRISLILSDTLSVGQKDEHGRINYHERDMIQSVKKGQRLGSFTRATDGIPGTNVSGSPVPAKPGTTPPFKVGENVRMAPNGQDIIAEADGMVQFIHSVLSVSETFEVSGDIDFNTGNIHMDHGAILIRGTIQPGFKVEASGNVVVGLTVNEADIKSGGDIEVKQGIIDGTVCADGRIFAKYAQNAILHAAGDIVIANNLQNCQTHAGDRVVIVDGKGIIRGGSIKCSNGVEAKEIGSQYDITTRIDVGNRSEDELKLLKDRADVLDSINQINHFLGYSEEPPDLSQYPEEERAGIQKVLLTLEEQHREITRIDSLLSSIRKRRRAHSNAIVKVHTVAYPGTHISIFGRDFVVKAPIKRSVFFYDEETDKIAVGPF